MGQRYADFIEHLAVAINLLDTMPDDITLDEVPFMLAQDEHFRHAGLVPGDRESMEELFGLEAFEYLYADRMTCLMDVNMMPDMLHPDRRLVLHRLKTRKAEFVFCLNMQRILPPTHH